MNVTCGWISEEDIHFYTDFLPPEITALYESSPGLLLYGAALRTTAVGVAAVQVLDTEALLRYLYVAPDFRRMGICAELLADLGFALWESGVRSLASYYVPGEHTDFHRQMELCGADFLPSGGGAFRFPLGSLAENKSLVGEIAGVSPLSACRETELMRVGGQLKREGADLVPVPIRASDYEADCSCVYKKDGEIRALLLVKQEEDAMDIPLLFSNAGNPAVFLMLIRFALKKGRERFSDDTLCTLRSVDEAMTRLLEKLLGVSAEAEVCARISLTDYDDYHLQFLERIMVVPPDMSGEADARLSGENGEA